MTKYIFYIVGYSIKLIQIFLNKIIAQYNLIFYIGVLAYAAYLLLVKDEQITRIKIIALFLSLQY